RTRSPRACRPSTLSYSIPVYPTHRTAMVPAAVADKRSAAQRQRRLQPQADPDRATPAVVYDETCPSRRGGAHHAASRINEVAVYTAPNTGIPLPGGPASG
ncbi:hypothetical protein ABVN23_25045, partial [Pseudomonas fluorescens]|uniref:hypothetical protein n=1 Tax=Pseudomonas fluorescens TaxID=294 RepID=UPI003F99F2B8